MPIGTQCDNCSYGPNEKCKKEDCNIKKIYADFIDDEFWKAAMKNFVMVIRHRQGCEMKTQGWIYQDASFNKLRLIKKIQAGRRNMKIKLGFNS